eukprot:364374-Chlamydomonas_euryale.AAC.2
MPGAGRRTLSVAMQHCMLPIRRVAAGRGTQAAGSATLNGWSPLANTLRQREAHRVANWTAAACLLPEPMLHKLCSRSQRRLNNHCRHPCAANLPHPSNLRATTLHACPVSPFAPTCGVCRPPHLDCDRLFELLTPTRHHLAKRALPEHVLDDVPAADAVAGLVVDEHVVNVQDEVRVVVVVAVVLGAHTWLRAGGTHM